MASNVFFIDFRASYKKNFVGKLKQLTETAGLPERIRKNDLVALKLHFGERGNTAFIRPVYIRHIVDTVKAAGAMPFLTDANTLYAGSRGNTVDHLKTAVENGFDFSVVNAPLVIADGLRGKSETTVSIDQKNCKEAYIASDIVEADALISIAHFKGHELTGFGGAIKNVGMGCASRRGKMDQHSDMAPKIKKKRCVGCGECARHCAQGAIYFVDEKAHIDPEKCVGCGECILVCEQGAVQIRWNQSIPRFMEYMVEYTAGVLKNKGEKSLFINFINHVSPACDCPPYNDAPIVRDIGVAAATDPVALDQACVDLVNNETALPGSCVKQNQEAGEDKFKGLYPKVDWPLQLAYAEEIGLGTRAYELIRL
ncbi:MAG: DUF362 domain-containing protein [Desulfobacterales bacterium]|nr:DUF362 domain-containing protein [Desulfobacterales bacterium]